MRTYDTYKLEVPECTIIVSLILREGYSTGHYNTVTLSPQGDVVSFSSGHGFHDADAETLAHKELADYLRERINEDSAGYSPLPVKDEC